MQILRLLAARRAAASTIDASTASEILRSAGEDDEGPFFDLDFSSCSLRASSSSSGTFSLADSDSDDDRTEAELDFIISLQRSHSASSLLRASEPPPARANSLQSQQHGARKRGIGGLRTMSFGARQAAPVYPERPSFAWTSSGRHSFSSGRSLRPSMDWPSRATSDEETAQTCRRAPSRDVLRRCLAKISRRLRTAASPRASDTRGLRRLRKCRSASSLAPRPSTPTTARGDDSVAEKQDGIAGAIAHCKDSLHRASASEADSPLLRSRSDPGKCEAA